MSESKNSSASREERLNEILAAYLDAVDGGEPPSEEELVARHPEFAAELREFLAVQGRVDHLARPFRELDPNLLAPTEEYRGPEPEETAVEYAPLQPAEAKREKIAVGEVFAGAYRVFDMKAGGMGRVYLAEWLQARSYGTRANVAIKTVADFDEWQHGRLSQNRRIDETVYRNILRRFEREAETWVALEAHDNILFALHVIDVGAKPYLVMEYADSGDLQTWIDAGRLTLPLALNFAVQFCRGMSHAVGTAGIVHRDIKPSNVLIKEDRIVKISDFGLSKSFDELLSDLHQIHDSLPGCLPIPTDTREVPRDAKFIHETYSLIALGRCEKAVKRADEGLARSPDNVELLINKSKACMELKDIDGALSCMERALAIRPRHALAWANLAGIRGEKGQLHAALDAAEHATRYDPQLAPAWNVRGWSEHMLGRTDDAIRSLQRAAELEPHDWRFQLNLGEVLGKGRRYREALAALRRAVNINPRSSDAWAKLGAVLSDLQRMSEANRAIDRALVLDPQNASAWAVRGLILWRWQRDASGAQACVDKALELDPQSDAGHMLSRELVGPGPFRSEPAVLTARDERTLPHDVPPANQASWMSRCRYWMCSCGAVFEKEDLEMKLTMYSGPGDVTILGTRTCANCRTTYQCRDIYAGKHDVPRQYWPQLESQQGKPVQV